MALLCTLRGHMQSWYVAFIHIYLICWIAATTPGPLLSQATGVLYMVSLPSGNLTQLVGDMVINSFGVAIDPTGKFAFVVRQLKSPGRFWFQCMRLINVEVVHVFCYFADRRRWCTL